MTMSDKNAILVAGMHRSGTSALTRVFSLLGADLLKRLALALPNNNEKGFWESVDLMIEHDALLESAGSFWSDWTEFNPDWYASAEATKYKKLIGEIVQADFAASTLFVIKDPRICRFLPFWLELLQEHAIKPFIMIPVRNPLEVAQSLKKRDGFPLAKGGLLWLRHVLDAVYYAQNYPIAFLSYEQLMQDWQGFVQSLQQQTDLAFPRQSVLSKLEIESYLEDDQKHNSVSLDDLKQSAEFSEEIVQAYEWLLLLVAGERRTEALQGLLGLRAQFNRESAVYAKVLLSEQQWNLQERKKLEARNKDALEYKDYLLAKRDKHYEQLTSQLNEHHQQQMEFQSNQLVLQAERMHELQLAKNALSTELAVAAKDRTELRVKVLELSETVQQQHGATIPEPALPPPPAPVIHPKQTKQFFKLIRTKPIVEPAPIPEPEPVNPAIELIEKSGLLDKDFYNASYRQIDPFTGSVAEHFYLTGATLGYQPNELFRTTWYVKQHPELQESGENPLVHYLTIGITENRQPHPLLDIEWYLGQYPDLCQLVDKQELNPLWHYLYQGGKELRNPNPLFLAAYYVAEYPEIIESELNPLVYYLKYGDQWHMDPHPLFDSRYYLRQIGTSLPEGMSALEHYLANKHNWRFAPSACFDSAWYLAEYPDVYFSELNPLVHYLTHGHKDGRKPHPKAAEKEFINQYKLKFRKAGVELVPPTKVQTSDVFSLVSPALKGMLKFSEQPLNPPNFSFVQDQLVIHWVTCDFAAQGGGGNMTIFRFMRWFELFGHEQHIWLHNQVVHKTTDEAYEDLIRHYQQLSAQIHFIDESFQQASGDLIIATDWESVWPVLSASAFKRRFYFVQDHEPSFFAAGSTSLAAEMTYHEDLDCICAGPWLEKLMRERYGRWATHFWLAADQQVYYPPAGKIPNAVPRIAFYARTSTSRRAVELGVLALNYLASLELSFHVEVYGADNNQVWLEQVSFEYTDHGVLAPEALGYLYRSCDIGMVFSATNYSLVPQEMMACDLPVLELDGENTRTVFPTGTVVLAAPHPRAIAERLEALLKDTSLREKTAKLGGEWARQFTWEATAQDVNQAVQQRLQDLTYPSIPLTHLPTKVSVVIPTLNGGDLLVQVVERVLEQKTPWPFDLLIIDSGSSDGSLELLRTKNVRIHAIPKAEFSHGGTRNLGVELTAGEYVAFLTQDALPVDAFWLFNLVSVLEHEPKAAGAFGKHLAYPEASPFVKRDLAAHFDHLAKQPIYLDKNTDAERFATGEAAWRQILHFYSDNNSCLRRSVWTQIPYPAIDYGEDQVWADLIIKAGYKKAYALNALVYHSHNYNEQETFERSQIEANFFYKQFGYVLLAGNAAYTKTLSSLNKQDAWYADLNAIESDQLKKQLALNEARLKGYLAVDFSS